MLLKFADGHPNKMFSFSLSNQSIFQNSKKKKNPDSLLKEARAHNLVLLTTITLVRCDVQETGRWETKHFKGMA